jgi:hypothetical protein
MWHRRAFLSAAGATFAASLLPQRAEALERAELVFASAIKDASGAFGAALVSERGDLIAKVGLPQRGHDICFSAAAGMAVDGASRVWFGCQFRGDNRRQPQLIGYATLAGDIRLIELTHDTLQSLRNYVGGVSVSADGQRIGISAPTGNSIVVLDAESHAVLAHRRVRSGSGMAPDGTGFLVSSGFGELTGVAGSPAGDSRCEFAFDNHLRLVPQSL